MPTVSSPQSNAASTPPLALFQRKYELTIQIPGTTYSISSDDSPALRFTFDLQQRAFQVFWVGDISVYNLSAATINDIMGVTNYQDIQVSLEAGYKTNSNGYGVVWSSPVFQLLFERENVIDRKLTFHCILGLTGQQQLVSGEYTGLTQPDIVRKLAAQTQTPVSALSTLIPSTKPSRPDAFFGSQSHYFTQIAEDANLQWYEGKAGLNFQGVNDTDIPAVPTLTFTPPALPQPNLAQPRPSSNADGVIVGTPQQVPGGVRFTALLDARVQVTKPYLLVKIDNSLIRKMLLYQQSPVPATLTVLDQDGVYIVAGTRFVGDSRGQAWYVEIDGITRTGGRTAMMLLQNWNTNRGNS